jgi:hypothetical protein
LPVPPQAHLVLGLLDGLEYRGGNPSTSAVQAHFVVTVNGSAVLDRTFTDPAEATAYVTDHPIDLGMLDPAATGMLDLGVHVDVNSTAIGGFGARLLFAAAPPLAATIAVDAATVPEPAIFPASLIVGAMLTRRQRCRKTAAEELGCGSTTRSP